MIHETFILLIFEWKRSWFICNPWHLKEGLSINGATYLLLLAQSLINYSVDESISTQSSRKLFRGISFSDILPWMWLHNLYGKIKNQYPSGYKDQKTSKWLKSGHICNMRIASKLVKGYLSWTNGHFKYRLTWCHSTVWSSHKRMLSVLELTRFWEPRNLVH